MQEQNSLLINEREIYDDLNRLQIDQLHKATLNFSNNSLETKKLCVAIESAVLTLLAGVFKDDPIDSWIFFASIFGIIIPLLFYLVDAVLWFYQDKLREKMIREENEIRQRHNLIARPIRIKSTPQRVFRSLFNGSQVMYFGLMAIALIATIIV